MDVRTATSEKFVLERAINRGGEAQIWTVRQEPHLVAKLYHKPTTEHQAKLGAMIAAPLTRKGTHPTVAWPLHLLYRQQQFIGYLMPRAAGSLPLFHYYNPARRRRLGQPHAWPRFLHRTATNLAAAVELVHAHQHVVGDLNESNVLVTQAALVTLVDTDSFQIKAGAPTTARLPQWLGNVPAQSLYRCGVGKAEYTPPELQGMDFKSIDRTPHHDNFALAVLIFYLLMDGFHPFSGVLTTGMSVGRVDLYGIKHGLFPYIAWGAKAPPSIQPPPGAPAFAHLHPGLQDAFRRTFTQGHTQPERRVTAKEWKQLLHEAEVALVTCPQNASHLYSRHLRRCPTCSPLPAPRSSAVTPVPVAQPLQEIPLSSPSIQRLATVILQKAAQQAQPWLATKMTLPPAAAPWSSLQQTVQTAAHELQQNVATLPDRLKTAQRVATIHFQLLGSWLLSNLLGLPLATGVALSGYALLPQVEQLLPLTPQAEVMIILALFAALWGASQSYALRRVLPAWRYLRYAWVGVTASAGAVIGAVSFRLLGADWQQVATWPAQPLLITSLAAGFGLLLGLLQSLLLPTTLRLAQDRRIWAIVNGLYGILVAQGWLWGEQLAYHWEVAAIADWQINAGLGALAGASLGALLSGAVLLWTVQGQRGIGQGLPRSYRSSFALNLPGWQPSARRWGRALLLLILLWFFFQIIAQWHDAAALVAPPLPTAITPHLLP
ncbi:MAG: hypothetical protein KF832_03850 [Caldilineaceae bacterium]|nr:hypothetical protein [Caldilineaceae bacterium]